MHALEALLVGLVMTATSTPLENTLSHLPPSAVATLYCESGLKQYDDDGEILRGKHGEKGIAQFLPSTWLTFNKSRGTDLDIDNPLAQLNMVEWAFAHRLQSHWTCYNQIYGTAR